MFEALRAAPAPWRTPEGRQLELQQRTAAEEATRKHAEETGVWDGIYSANRSGLTGAIVRSIEELQFAPTAGWRIPEEAEARWKGKGIRPEQWSLFAKAYSDEHLDWLEHIALQNQENEYTLSEFGVLGNLALGMTDIAGLGIDIASGGLGYAAKAGRLVNLARSGTVAAASTGLVMAAAAEYNPEITLADVGQATALSFALGGVFGARKGALHQDTLNPDAVKRAAGIGGDGGSLSAARVEGAYIDTSIRGATSELRPENAREKTFRERAEENHHIHSHFRNVRIDLAARMNKAKSPLVREAGRLLFRDGVGYTDRNTAVAESTSEYSKRHLAVLETAWRREFNPAWAAYRKANNIPVYNVNARIRFNEEVGRAVRGLDGVSPEAQQAASGIRETMRKALQLAKEANLPGFEDLGSNPNYLPRYWSSKGFHRLMGELGLSEDDVVGNLIRPALRKAWSVSGRVDEIDDELLDVVAKAYFKRAQKHFEGDGMELLVRPLDKDSVDEIGRLMHEAGVSPHTTSDLLKKLSADVEDAGKIDRAKRRIDLDETYTAKVVNSAGDEVEISMSDLFENDVELVMSRYLREITGWAALSTKADIKTRSQLDRFLAQIKTDAKYQGDDVKAIERMMDIGINATFGRSTEIDPASSTSRYSRFIRNWNFSRVMNQVGFTMLAELGPAIAHSGLRNVLKSIPEIPAMLKRGRDGSLGSEEARIMEELFAPGTDLMRNPPFLRLDEEGAMVQPTFGFKGAHHVDNALNAANHVTSIASGMAPITAILQRMAGRATLLKMMDAAHKGNLTKGEIAMLRSGGLDAAAQKQVFDYLKTVNKIADIQPDKLPLETRERLSAFMYRATRHQVLEGDAADSIEWMHGPVGRLVLQFRTFMVTSYSRHFLNSIHHYDSWRTYQMLVYSTAFAGIGWSARAYLNTLHDKEARERLLTPENMVKNAIAQSSYAAFLPALTDFAVGDILGHDPIFQGNRSTGLQNGIRGIPTLDLLTKLINSGGMIGSMLKADEHVTEQQMLDFWRIWWFSNLSGVRNMAESGIDAWYPDRPDGTNR